MDFSKKTPPKPKSETLLKALIRTLQDFQTEIKSFDTRLPYIKK